MLNTIIVDDEPAVAKIICYFIEKKNLPINIVGIAKNGREAINLIEEEDIELVFLDIRMPFMDGFEVMAKAPNKNFIIITAYDSFEYAQKALRLGAKDILLKPIEYKQLIQSIERAIGWNFTDSDILNKILDYINNNYNEQLNLTHLAELFFVSPSHISRLFKNHMNMSTIAYINEVRINKAIELLEEGKFNIKEISELIGYNSLNNFYKYFKFHTGITPGEYV